MRNNRLDIFFATLLVSIAVLFVVTPLRAETKSRVAIVPFSLLSAQKNETSLVVQRIIAAELAKSPLVEIIPANQTAMVLRRNRGYSDKKVERIAQALRADYLLVGSIVQLGERINLYTKIWSSKNGSFVPIRAIEEQGMDSLQIAIEANFKDYFLFSAGLEAKVMQVDIVGNDRIGVPAIRQYIKVTNGDTYSAEAISSDIKTIFGMGFFDDVAANVTKTDIGINVLYTVCEKPLMSSVNITGNDKIDIKQIRSLISAKPQEVLNVMQINKDIEKIKQFYLSKGYYGTDIKTTFQRDEKTRTVAVNMVVYEGKKLYITKLVFRGNTAFSDNKLKDLIKTKEKGWFSFLTDRGILKEAELEQDLSLLEAFYASNGFVENKVSKPRISYTDKGIEITIEIQEGRRFRIGNVSIEGDELKTSTHTMLENLQTNKKEFFDHYALVMDREYLQKEAQNEGYASALVTTNSSVNEDNRTIDIVFNLIKGPMVRINRVYVTGHAQTNEKVILRGLAFTEGEIYSRKKLEESQIALERLNYFSEVTLQTQAAGNDTADVFIQVKEKETGTLSFGIAYSSSEHAAATAQIAKDNFLGEGQYLSLQGTVSGSATRFTLSFVEPFLFDYNIWSRFEAWNRFNSYDSYNLHSRGASTTLGYQLMYGIYSSMTYRLSRNDITDVADNAAKSIKEQKGARTTSSLELGLYKEDKDSNIFPTRGYSASFITTYAGIGGDVKFNKYVGSLRSYTPINENLVLSLFGTLGLVEETGKSPLPTYERFSLGGIGALTGLTQVGPRDPQTGDFIGGRTMMLYGSEVLFPLAKDAGLMGTLFYNMGNTWERGYYLKDMRHTTGAGIRWNSPIGPIRLECGFPLDRRKYEAPYRIEFTLGMRL